MVRCPLNEQRPLIHLTITRLLMKHLDDTQQGNARLSHLISYLRTWMTSYEPSYHCDAFPILQCIAHFLEHIYITYITEQFYCYSMPSLLTAWRNKATGCQDPWYWLVLQYLGFSIIILPHAYYLLRSNTHTLTTAPVLPKSADELNMRYYKTVVASYVINVYNYTLDK